MVVNSSDSDPRHPKTPKSDGAPLGGIRVLDMTQIIAGPFCTTILANLGAEVVKLEPPGHGDEMRIIGRYKGREEHEDYFNANNYSKKSIVLDLKDPDGLAAGRELAKRADVLVENFAPGTVKRLGMGWDDIRSLNPRLIYCSLSGFGQTGPYSDRLAMDPVIQAVSGVMSVTGHLGGEPAQIGAPLADVIAGMFAAHAILGALLMREHGEEGQYIDISMQAAMIAVLGPRMGETLQAGISPQRIGNQNPMRVPSDVYKTKDGVRIFIMVQNDRNWEPFCRALDCPHWLEDPRFATSRLRAKNRERIDKLVVSRFAEWTAEDLIPRLESERVPFAHVNNYAEALADPQILHRGQIRALDHPTAGQIRVTGPPWIMSKYQAEMEPPPLYGQHTEEVLGGWLGWSGEDTKRFRK